MSAGTLVVKIAANITDFSKGLDAAEKRLMKAGEKLERLGSDLSLKVTAPLLAAGALLAKSAAEDAASVEKMGRSFGRAQGQMEEFVQSLMKSVPATDDALRGMVVSTNTLLGSLGVAPAKATAMTQAVTKLAGDLAAFNHVSQEVAQDALEKALMGKTRGLASLNIAVSEADVKQKAYAMGLATAGSELTKSATAQAALALAIERSGKQQGEAARTIGNSANAMAVLKQKADSVADSFGAVVLPTMLRVVQVAGVLADTLAGLSGWTKTAIIGTLALAAAYGPLLYVVGNTVKVFALLRTGALALGFTSLSTTIFSARAAFAAAAIAGTGFRGVMIGLAPVFAPFLAGAAIVAGITAIGYALWKSGEAARIAGADLDAYQSKLASFSDASDSRATAKSVLGQLRTLEATPLKLTGFAGPDAQIRAERDRQQKALQDRLRAANQRTVALTAPDIRPPLIPPPPGTGATKDPYADLEEKAGRLGRVYALTNAKGQPLAGLNAQITSTIDALSAALAKQSDKWGEVALKIREAMESLERFGEATFATAYKSLPALTKSQLTAKIGNTSAGSIPSASAPMANVGPLSIKEPPAILKQTTLQERMVAQLATLPAQFASQLGSYLGPVLARLGGGKGGAIGAALGGGIGSAIGTALVPAGMGKIAGAVVGSVLPVVGTVIGSLVGAGIGSAIGKLFGRKRNDDAAEMAARRLNEMAEAARKVSEAISGIPQGIRLASYRFEATDTTDPRAPESRRNPGGQRPDAPGSRSINISGPITVTGVTDLPSFFRALTSYAEGQAERGGVNGLQLATTR